MGVHVPPGEKAVADMLGQNAGVYIAGAFEGGHLPDQLPVGHHIAPPEAPEPGSWKAAHVEDMAGLVQALDGWDVLP